MMDSADQSSQPLTAMEGILAMPFMTSSGVKGKLWTVCREACLVLLKLHCWSLLLQLGLQALGAFLSRGPEQKPE